MAQEKARYALHQNSLEDSGYVDYLGRLLIPLCEVLPPSARGIDFGCGPEPVLAELLRRKGHRVSIWDPIFANEPSVLDVCYQFITVTEVVEHFHFPMRDFSEIDRLLEPGGTCGLMTQQQPDAVTFEEWWYAGDETHVAFYSDRTFRWIATRFGWTFKRVSTEHPCVVLFTKLAPTSSE